MKKTLLTLIVSLFATVFVFSQNPLVTNMYTADPTARVFNGKLYIYPSSDIVPKDSSVEKEYPRFCMPGYHIFSLENGSTIKDHGWALKYSQVPWGDHTYTMWAPDCIEKNGKYYFYYPAKPADGSAFRMIGVGVSDNPTGPFKWEKSYIPKTNGIDPGLLLDDDNKAYLFFGGGEELHVARLKDNMKELDMDPIVVEGLPYGYKEGSFPFKRNGKYYLSFAHVFTEEGYTIGYAMSDKPMGPYKYMGKIMDNIGQGTNHHSVVEYKNKWILFYHHWDISGYNKLRSICADYMQFKKDGTIRKVKPTLRGIGIPTIGDTIQVDRCNEIYGATTPFLIDNGMKGWCIAEAKTGAYVKFDNVDFGAGNVKKIKARISCGQRKGSIIIYSDRLNGKKIAEFPITYSGGWNVWKTIECNIKSKISGIHNIYIKFVNDGGSTKTANLNWILME